MPGPHDQNSTPPEGPMSRLLREGNESQREGPSGGPDDAELGLNARICAYLNTTLHGGVDLAPLIEQAHSLLERHAGRTQPNITTGTLADWFWGLDLCDRQWPATMLIGEVVLASVHGMKPEVEPDDAAAARKALGNRSRPHLDESPPADTRPPHLEPPRQDERPEPPRQDERPEPPRQDERPEPDVDELARRTRENEDASPLPLPPTDILERGSRCGTTREIIDPIGGGFPVPCWRPRGHGGSCNHDVNDAQADARYDGPRRLKRPPLGDPDVTKAALDLQNDLLAAADKLEAERPEAARGTLSGVIALLRRAAARPVSYRGMPFLLKPSEVADHSFRDDVGLTREELADPTITPMNRASPMQLRLAIGTWLEDHASDSPLTGEHLRLAVQIMQRTTELLTAWEFNDDVERLEMEVEKQKRLNAPLLKRIKELEGQRNGLRKIIAWLRRKHGDRTPPPDLTFSGTDPTPYAERHPSPHADARVDSDPVVSAAARAAQPSPHAGNRAEKNGPSPGQETDLGNRADKTVAGLRALGLPDDDIDAVFEPLDADDPLGLQRRATGAFLLGSDPNATPPGTPTLRALVEKARRAGAGPLDPTSPPPEMPTDAELVEAATACARLTPEMFETLAWAPGVRVAAERLIKANALAFGIRDYAGFECPNLRALAFELVACDQGLLRDLPHRSPSMAAIPRAASRAVQDAISSERAWRLAQPENVPMESVSLRDAVFSVYRRASEAWEMVRGGASDSEVLAQLRQAATVSIRAMEVHGAPQREGYEVKR